MTGVLPPVFLGTLGLGVPLAQQSYCLLFLSVPKLIMADPEWIQDSVVWCSVPKVLSPKGNGRDALPRRYMGVPKGFALESQTPSQGGIFCTPKSKDPLSLCSQESKDILIESFLCYLFHRWLNFFRFGRIFLGFFLKPWQVRLFCCLQGFDYNLCVFVKFPPIANNCSHIFSTFQLDYPACWTGARRCAPKSDCALVPPNRKKSDTAGFELPQYSFSHLTHAALAIRPSPRLR